MIKDFNMFMLFSYLLSKVRVRIILLMILAGTTNFIQQLFAQGYGAPLTMQGLNHTSVYSAGSRSSAGLSVGMKNDVSLMFINPAALSTLEGLQLTIGSVRQSGKIEQKQQWLPLRYLPTFSLMMEGLLDSIPVPNLDDYDPSENGPLGYEDSIPRPFDSIKPNWSRTNEENVPFQFFVAYPLELQGIKIVGAAGIVQYANLNYYFQNNNILSPSIGSQRPYGVPLPGTGIEVPVLWSQSSQSRKGGIDGFGAALSVNISEKFSIGASGLLLNGKTDDVEFSNVRGQILFGNNEGIYYYRLDSVYSRISSTGTSEFSGTEFAISALFQDKYISLGVTVKPASVITRKYKSTVTLDTTAGVSTTSLSGTDQITLPWKGSAGLSLKVRENVMIGIEYELLPYADAEYKSVTGAVIKPWLSNSALRFGAEFMPIEWLAMRAGISKNAEVFEQEGNALVGEPVKYTTYSVGMGITFSNIRLNVGYDYSLVKYQDTWQTNVNLNSDRRNNIFADIAFSMN